VRAMIRSPVPFCQSQSQSHITTDGQSVCLGVKSNLGLLTRDIFFSGSKLRSCLCGASSLTRGRVCHLLVLVDTVYSRSWSLSSCCGRQSVDQFAWVSGLPLGPLTRFYLVLLSSSDNYFILLL
jgi:hypothetical protein